MNKLINYIDRKESVITKKNNLEHLYTFKDFPIFFGCTIDPPKEDIVADMIWGIDPYTGIIQLSKLVPLHILYMEQHVDATGLTWDKYTHAFAEYVLKNKKGDILEIGGGSGKLANIILDKDNEVNYTVIEPNPTFKERNNLKVVKSFFTKEFKGELDPNSTVIFSQVYEHAYDPEEFLTEITEFLPIGGKMVFAYPQLEHWFKNKFTNAINFEHTLLMTDHYVDYFLQKTGFKIIEKIEYEKHSHFYTVEKVSSILDISYNGISNHYQHYKEMFKRKFTCMFWI